MANDGGKNDGGRGGKPRKNAKGQGRKKTPTSVQRAKGNPGRRPLNEQEPDFGNVTYLPGAKPQEEQQEAKGKSGRRKATAAERPPVPEELQDDPVAMQTWLTLAPLLAKQQVLQRTDVNTLIAACMAWGGVVQSKALIAVHGYVVAEPVLDKEGNEVGVRRKRNPAAIQLKESMQLYRSYASELGLTPSSRTALFGNAGSQEDDLENWLRGHAKG